MAMKTEEIFGLVEEVVSLAVPGANLAIGAIKALSALVSQTGGDKPTPEQINALVDKIKTQSAEIQTL